MDSFLPQPQPPESQTSASRSLLRASLPQGPSSTPSTATTITASCSTPGTNTPKSSGTASTTTRTRERLRLAELERDELREAAHRAGEVAERLKREAGPKFGLSAEDARDRVSQLKRDILAAGRGRHTSNEGLFKTACSTDLLFLIDTTGSMSGHIRAAKEQVRSIMKDVKEAFLNEAEVRVAVVGYKDHGNDPSIQCLDFTSSADEVHTFVAALVASGGLDCPEDVLGGLRQAINATWKHQTRCIIHIADCPPHGNTLQALPQNMGDRFPVPGSEPHGLTHEPLLKQMIDLKINYALLRITCLTDKMAFAFFEAYVAANADCNLHFSNQYFSEAYAKTVESRTRSSGASKGSAKGGLLFEEAALGTTFSALSHLVGKVVANSASRTAVRVSSSRSRTTRTITTGRDMTSHMRIIEEDEDIAEEVQLERIPPEWDSDGWLNETLVVEGFSPDVIVHGSSTLNDMMENDDNIVMSVTELTVNKRMQPFAVGAMRLASYARTASSDNRFVVKSSKRDGKQLPHLAEDMRCQALCKAFALEFNNFFEVDITQAGISLVSKPHSIDFIVTTCLKGKVDRKSRDNCMSLEPFIEGTYVKYNNNVGYVHKDSNDQFNQAAQAFSHFTFERSKGEFLVCDLQGVGKVLTDPVIHTQDPERFKLADNNLGKEGFKFFFSTHKCNAICRKLGLKTSAAMIISGEHEFREDWPSMDNTACCSNKLCGKIVRLASAKKSDDFPGYKWCDACWPQLEKFKTKLLCVEPVPDHEFEVSEFFYESQGRKTPRKCPEHREEDLVSRPVKIAKPVDVESRTAVGSFVLTERPGALGYGSGASGSGSLMVGSGSATVHASSATVSRFALAGYDAAGRDRNLWDRLRSATRKKSSIFRRS